MVIFRRWELFENVSKWNGIFLGNLELIRLFWITLCSFRLFWINLDIFDSLWILDSFGSLWNALDRFLLFQITMEPFKFYWTTDSGLNCTFSVTHWGETAKKNVNPPLKMKRDLSKSINFRFESRHSRFKSRVNSINISGEQRTARLNKTDSKLMKREQSSTWYLFHLGNFCSANNKHWPMFNSHKARRRRRYTKTMTQPFSISTKNEILEKNLIPDSKSKWRWFQLISSRIKVVQLPSVWL